VVDAADALVVLKPEPPGEPFLDLLHGVHVEPFAWRERHHDVQHLALLPAGARAGEGLGRLHQLDRPRQILGPEIAGPGCRDLLPAVCLVEHIAPEPGPFGPLPFRAQAASPAPAGRHIGAEVAESAAALWGRDDLRNHSRTTAASISA